MSALVVVAAFECMDFSYAVAADPATPPSTPLIGAGGLMSPQPQAPLRGVMRLNPSKFGARPTSGSSLSESGIQGACSAVDPSRYTQLLRSIELKENACTAAAYSVEDQRSAGCSGADTVDQCQTKLYDYCMNRSGDRAAFRNGADQELSVARRARDKLDAYMQYIANTASLHTGANGGFRLPPYTPPKPDLGTIIPR